MWAHLIPAQMDFGGDFSFQLRKGLDWADLWTLLCLNQLTLRFFGGLKALAYRCFWLFWAVGRVVDSLHFSASGDGEAGDQRDLVFLNKFHLD
jgi:hypothetical protein